MCRKKKPTKKDVVDKHFCRRCIERLGYMPDPKHLVQKIQHQELEFYDRQSTRLTRWYWLEPVFKIPCLLVYDKIRQQIVTILFYKQELDKSIQPLYT